MQRLVLRSLLAATSALFLLHAAACDKAEEKKAPEKKAEEKKEPEPTPEPAGTTSTTTGAPEPAGTTSTTTGGAEAGAEAGGAEAGAEGGAEAPAAEGDGDGEPKTDTTKTDTTKTDTTKTDTTKTETTKTDTSAASSVDAKGLFDKKCKSCHGADGKGDTTIGKKVNIPSLAGTKLSKADVTKKISDGVPDTKMKGYKDSLSKDEIDALTTYVKKL